MSVIVIVFLSLYFVFIFGVQVSAVSGYVQPESILSLGVIACIMLTLITSVASGYSVLFGGKDHDAVLSPAGGQTRHRVEQAASALCKRCYQHDNVCARNTDSLYSPGRKYPPV